MMKKLLGIILFCNVSLVMGHDVEIHKLFTQLAMERSSLGSGLVFRRVGLPNGKRLVKAILLVGLKTLYGCHFKNGEPNDKKKPFAMA